jgi:Family of unknown function (DUF5343)
MDTNVPYMPSVGNLQHILDKIQNAGVPEVFNLDFLRDLGFTSSNDRAVVKLLKYLGFLDPAGRPQTSYREFMDHTQAKSVLAGRLRTAYDDLFLADRDAHTRAAQSLKGWFKTKTGESDAVAGKIATTFKALASYADFAHPPAPQIEPVVPPTPSKGGPAPAVADANGEGNGAVPIPADTPPRLTPRAGVGDFGFVYRLEIHLPDTQNVETFRAIFRALREEMIG